jgi:hypothetical protein
MFKARSPQWKVCDPSVEREARIGSQTLVTLLSHRASRDESQSIEASGPSGVAVNLKEY